MSARRVAYLADRVIADCHPGQRRVIRELLRGAPLVCLASPIRWGKTDGWLRWALRKALLSGRAECVYLAMHRSSAKAIARPALLKICEQYGIEPNENRVDLTYRPHGRGCIQLSGADDWHSMEQLRGRELDDVCIDEAQSWSRVDMQYLTETLLSGRTADRRGAVVMQGTIHRREPKFFRHVREGRPGWAVVRGKPAENPHNREALLARMEQLRAANPDVESMPWYRREWLGEDVPDSSGLVLRVPSGSVVEYVRSPADEYVLGIDWGYVDPSAFVLLACRSGVAHVIEAWERPGMSLADTVSTLREYQRRYPGLCMVADPGGNSKQLTEELRNEYGIPLVPASKTHKRLHAEMLQRDVDLRRLIIDPRCSDLLSNLGSLAWVGDGQDAEIGTPRHMYDALLYARRQLNITEQEADVEAENGPVLYSADWFAALDSRAGVRPWHG